MDSASVPSPEDSSAPAPRRKRRRWRRLLVRALLVLVAVLTLVVLLRNVLVEQLVPPLVGPLLGLDISIESVDIGLGGTIVVRGFDARGPSDWTVVRELGVDELTVRVDWGTLVFGDLSGVRSVELDARIVDLDLDRPGVPPSDEPEEPIVPSDEPFAFPWPARLPSLHVDLASLWLRSADASFELRQIRVRSDGTEATPDGARLQANTIFAWDVGRDADARHGESLVEVGLRYDPGTASEIRLTVDDALVVESGTFHLDSLDARLVVTEIAGAGVLAVSGLFEETLLARIQLERLDAADLLARTIPGLLPIEGVLGVDLSVEMPWERPEDTEASFDVRVSRGRFDVVGVDRLELSASCSSRHLVVERLRVDAPSLSLSSDRLAARLDLEWSRFLASIVGSLEVRSSDVATTVGLFVDAPLVLDSLRRVSLDARLDLREEMVDATRLVVLSDEIAIDASGASLGWGSPEPADWALVVAAQVVVEEIPAVLARFGVASDTLEGRARVAVNVEGALEDLRTRARLDASGVRVQGVSLGEVSASVAQQGARIEIERLSMIDGVSALPLVPPALRVALSGSIDLDSLIVDGMKLETRVRDLPDRIAPLNPDLRALLLERLGEDIVRVELEVSGPVAWPDLALSLEVAPRSTPLTHEPQRVRVTKSGDRVGVRARNLRANGARISTELSGDLSAELDRAELTVTQLEIAEGAVVWSGTRPADIVYDLTQRSVTLSPPLEVTSEDGSVLVSLEETERAPVAGVDAVDREAVFRDAVLRVEFDLPRGPPLRVVREFADLDTIAVRLDARLAGPLLAPLFDGPAETRGFALPRSLRLEARAHGARFHAEDLLAEATGIELRCEIENDGEDPRARLDAAISRIELASSPGLTELREPLEGSLALAARWEGGSIELSTLQASLGPITAEGQGSLVEPGSLSDPSSVGAWSLETPLAARLDLRVEDLALLRELVPNLRRIEGKMHVAGQVRGTIAEPSPELEVSVDGVECRLGSMPGLTGVSGRIGVSTDRIEIESIVGELGGSKFLVGGSVSGWSSAPVLDLRLDGDNLLLARSDTVRLRADAHLTVSGPVESLAVGGDLRITDGRVLQRIPLVENLRLITSSVGNLAGEASERSSTASQRSYGLKLFSLRGAPLDAMRFDVGVTCSDSIELRSNVFRGSVRPDVRLRGTGEVPFLAGTVYLEDLVISLPTTKIRVRSGAARFDEKSPLFPELFLTGTTRIRGYDVEISISGRVHEPTVVFTSNPPLPADELVLLVMTGKPPGESAAGSERAAVFAVAKYLGEDLLRLFLTDEDVDASESILERFDLDVGRNVSRSGSETWEARFRLRRDLVSETDTVFLTGERDAFDHYNIGLRISFRAE